MRRNSWKAKLGIFLGSLLLCLGALEAGLRLTGTILDSSRQRVFVPQDDKRGRILADDYFEKYGRRGSRGKLILTFGDSLTNSGNVKSRHSYPYFLYKAFSDAGERASVYNMGYCEDSTFGVALKLKNYLLDRPVSETPDAVVILAGAADLFNVPLIRSRNLKDDTFWRDMTPGPWLYELRMYKMFRHIRMSLQARKLLGSSGTAGRIAGSERTVEEKFKALLEVYEAHKQAAAGDESRPLSPELVAKLDGVFGGDYQQADLDFGEIGDFIELITDYASRAYTTRHRYDDLFDLMLDVAVHYPRNFWIDYINTANYSLVQSYQFQSRRTAAEVLAVLDRSEKKHPELGTNEHYLHFRKILSAREEMDDFVDKKRMETWDEIVRLSRERGIRVVVQTYPAAYSGANRVLRAVAEKHGLPLVDNRTLFEGLLREGGRERFMEDDDHLTPEGYERLARNVYNTLKGI